MIYESSYWKQPLLLAARKFKIIKAVEDYSDKELARIERDIFIGFYSIRKLFEAPGKVTDATKNMRAELLWYRNTQKVHALNYHKFDELYDLEKSNSEQRDVLFICQRIIHSYVFSLYFDELGFAGIYFSSDIDKDNKIYAITKQKIIEIFEKVGTDYPITVKWQQDPTSDSIKVTAT